LKKLKICKRILAKYRSKGGSVISILQDVQVEFGYIPEDVLFWFSDELTIPSSNFYGVATFYSQFSLKPPGKNIITVCCGTACHVKGSDEIIRKVRAELSIPETDDTTRDNQFTVHKIACVGACSMAPVFMVNGIVYGNSSPDRALEKLSGYKKQKV